MNREEETSDSIPIDIVLEILSRLPAKSVARFSCVSKLWGSMLCRPYFTDLFRTSSSARPHLLFVVKRQRIGEFMFFSSSQRKNPYDDKSSLVVATGFHMRLADPEDKQLHVRGYASGLICFRRQIRQHNVRAAHIALHVICNPSTGQCARLPELRTFGGNTYSFLGFDPIGKQFKVLSMAQQYSHHKILTLGTGELRWRKLQGPLGHDPKSCHGICINGVLYYLTRDMETAAERMKIVLVSFDVRSEKFKFITANCFDGWIVRKLVNYKGKLGGIRLLHASISGSLTLQLSMCVLEDMEKQEWSQYDYTFPKYIADMIIAGVTATGEIVLLRDDTSRPFYVFYLNPERNTLQCVEIQSNHEAFATYDGFVDHVEDVDHFNI